MISITDKFQCSGCSACYNVCPSKAIFMMEDNEGFLYPHVKNDLCINCGLCDKVCPYKQAKKTKTAKMPEVYACYYKDEKARLESSSGGIFPLLSRYVLSKEGVVFGAGYDSDFNVCHSYIEQVEDLCKLIGSKYAQSDLGDCFSQAREFLNQGRLVLFSGTSCQIAGLKAFLRKEFDNLICIDLICLGVPSRSIWRNYVKYFYLNRGKVHNIVFKDKSAGWDLFSINVFYDTRNFFQIGQLNAYMRMYFKHLNVRQACINCPFKGTERDSDFTLADCWGIENIAPELNDNKGISTVFLHSEKANKIFEELSSELVSKKTDFAKAVEKNPYAVKACEENPARESFFSEYKELPFRKFVKKYGHDPKNSIMIRLKLYKRKLKSLKKRVTH